MAWPGYKGYPPTYTSTREAGANTRIDYGLKVHGRQGGFTIKCHHPDVIESRINRSGASGGYPTSVVMPSHLGGAKLTRGVY